MPWNGRLEYPELLDYPLETFWAEIYAPTGGPILNGIGGDALTEVSDGFWVFEVAEDLEGDYSVRIVDSTGMVWRRYSIYREEGQEDVWPEGCATKRDVGDGAATPEQIATAVWSFGSRTLTSLAGLTVTVAAFAEGLLQQLAGMTIRRKAPAWTLQGFDEGIVRGDSYLGDLAWTLRVNNFEGPNLEGADSITMTLRNGSQSESWTFEAEQVDDTTYDLAAQLTSADTSIDKGLWNVTLVAHWDAGDETPEQNVTLIGPRAPLQIKGT